VSARAQRAGRDELAPETEQTYRQIRELMRSGVPTAKQAMESLAESSGVNFTTIQGRYYAARKRHEPDAEQKAGPRPKGRAPAAAAAAAQTNGGGVVQASVPELLEQAAALLERAAAQSRRDARDAAQWRTVAAMLQKGTDTG